MLWKGFKNLDQGQCWVLLLLQPKVLINMWQKLDRPALPTSAKQLHGHFLWVGIYKSLTKEHIYSDYSIRTICFLFDIFYRIFWHACIHVFNLNLVAQWCNAFIPLPVIQSGTTDDKWMQTSAQASASFYTSSYKLVEISQAFHFRGKRERERDLGQWEKRLNEWSMTLLP